MDAADNIRRIKEQAKLPKQPKPRKPIAKVSEKKKQQIKGEKAVQSGGGNELDRWFQARRKEMTGRCLHCGEKTTKHQDKWYRASIAHILPKRLFKSVATHPLNWIELCFWSNNCHAQFDDFKLDITELNCYDLVIERFIAIYPDIAPKERRFIPDALLQYVKNEKDI